MEQMGNSLARIAQNLEQVPRESKLQKIGDPGQSLSLALQSSKILTSPVEDIKQALRYVMVKIGLRSANWPSEEEKIILIQHIQKNFGNHTIDEIRLAFDMAISGQLDLGASEIACYENFSCLYFSNVMNSYRRWAKEEVKQIPMTKEIEDAKENLTDQTMRDWLESIKKQNLGIEFMPVMIYDWLESTGEIKLTTEEKKSYMDRAREYFLKNLNNETRSVDEVKLILKNLAKRIVIHDLINK